MAPKTNHCPSYGERNPDGDIPDEDEDEEGFEASFKVVKEPRSGQHRSLFDDPDVSFEEEDELSEEEDSEDGDEEDESRDNGCA